MKNSSDIKCPFCGCEMTIETWDHAKPCQTWTKCPRCEACGPRAYHDHAASAEALAIKAMEDYYNKIDADLWRASRPVTP